MKLTEMLSYLALIAAIILLTIGYIDLDKRITKLEEKKYAFYLVEKGGKTHLLKEVK